MCRSLSCQKSCDFRWLECVRAVFARADADGLKDVGHEDLAVADLAGLGGAHDRVGDLLELRVVDHDLDLHLGQKVDHVLGAAIKLGVALLSAEAAHVCDGHALQACILKRLFHIIQFEWFDNGFDFLHCASPRDFAATGVTDRKEREAEEVSTVASVVLLSADQMRAAEAAAINAGVASASLMETAGDAVAQVAMKGWSKRPVAVVCGPGNNGGDGLAIARMLHAIGCEVTAVDACKVFGIAGHNLEQVIGRLHGRRGSFVLQHYGIVDRGQDSLLLEVVP